MDAVAAAPGNHRVLLENDRVRVLEVTVNPGEREPLHAHCPARIVSNDIVVRTCATILV
jgi:hypothetical protein